MKKLIALVIALMMFALPALADTLTYTHPNRGYTLEYPAAWLAVDSSNVDQYIDLYNSGKMAFTGTNAETLTQLKAQIAAQDMAVLVDPYANNVVVVAADVGMEITTEMFQMIMVPMLVEQIKAEVPGIEITDEGTIQELGDRSVITVGGTYTMSGIEVEIMQIYYLKGTMMYAFNLTANGFLGQDIVAQFALEALSMVGTFEDGK